METNADTRAVVVGAGLAGPLLASMIARHGYQVDMVEGRPDPRAVRHEGGRSINLGMSAREIGRASCRERVEVSMVGVVIANKGSACVISCCLASMFS